GRDERRVQRPGVLRSRRPGRRDGRPPLARVPRARPGPALVARLGPLRPGLVVPRAPDEPAMTAAEPSRRYALITPCRDEAAFARRTLDSVVAQTVLPALWLIVDDGSTDDTPAILAEYAARFDFIRLLRRDDRGRRSVGPGVVDAFYAGYETIDPAQFD